MSAETVPAWPFMTWLADFVRRVGNNVARDRLQLGGDAWAELLKTDPDAVLPLKRVDILLTRAEDTETLATLYPEADRPAGRRSDLGRSYVCDEATLIRAHAMHLDGMSVRAVARELFAECYSASEKSLTNSFLTAWRGRGWEVRGRSEATALANRARGWRPQCQHVLTQGERRGLRCTRRCQGNDEWCWHHHPEQRAAGIARLRAGAPA